MSGFHRMITYLYLYEQGQKGRNAGFAKIEKRDARCLAEIHMKNTGYSSPSLPVYFYVQKQGKLPGIPLGNMDLSRGSGDFKILLDAEDLLGSGYSLADVKGIFLPLSETTMFVSQWDDDPFLRERFVALKPEDAANGSARPTHGGGKPEGGADGADGADDGTKRRSDGGRQAQSRTDSAGAAHSGAQRTDGAGAARSSGRQMPNGVGGADDGTKRRSDGGRQTHNGTASANLTHSGAQKTEDKTNCAELAQSGQMPDGTAAGSADFRTVDLETPEHGITVNTGNRPDAPSLTQGTQPQPPSSNVKATEAAPKSFGNPSRGPRHARNLSSWKPAESLPEDWDLKWNLILENYPVMTPFAGDDTTRCVRLDLKDLRLLPRQFWYLGNNSFLLHGFFNYRHLILGLTETSGGKRWFLGVPGVFQNPERVMAALFGFPEFRCEKSAPIKTGEFGYWYRHLN